MKKFSLFARQTLGVKIMQNFMILTLLFSVNIVASEIEYGSALIAAVSENNEKKVKKILKQIKNIPEVDINSLVDDENNPLLFRAVANENVSILRQLLEFPLADINKKDAEGRSVADVVYALCFNRMVVNPLFKLHSCPTSLFLERAPIELMNYKNIDISNENGLLRSSYMSNKLDFVALLLNYESIDPNTKVADGVPLLIDVYNNYALNQDIYFPLIKKLLKHEKIDINSSCNNNKTILHKICFNDMLVATDAHNNFEILEMVLKRQELDINKVDGLGKTPLHDAVIYACALRHKSEEVYPFILADYSKYYEEQLVIIKCLLKSRKVDLSIKDYYERTVWDISKKKDCMGIMVLLLECSVEILHEINDITSIPLDIADYFNAKNFEQKKEILSQFQDQENIDLFLSGLFISLFGERKTNDSKIGRDLKHIIELGVSSENIGSLLFYDLKEEQRRCCKRMIKYALRKKNIKATTIEYLKEIIEPLKKENEKLAKRIEEYVALATKQI